MQKEYPDDFVLPPKETVLGPVLQGDPINIDTIAIFSASQRANKGRARHRHGGQTASIYLSEKLGGKQVGTLFQVITQKSGAVMIDSVPDQRSETLLPIINKNVPKGAPVFTDEGYSWLPYRNARQVNHSAKSTDPRYKVARDRWSKDGVHSQTAEGMQGSIKTAFRAYRSFKPKYSRVYASEWAYFSNVAKGVCVDSSAQDSDPGRGEPHAGQYLLGACGRIPDRKGNVLG